MVNYITLLLTVTTYIWLINVQEPTDDNEYLSFEAS